MLKKKQHYKLQEDESAFRAEVNEQGQLGFLKTVGEPVREFLSKIKSGDGWFDKGAVEPDIINSRIQKVKLALDKYADSTKFSLGDKAVATRNLMMSGEIDENFWGRNTIKVRLRNGGLKTLEDASLKEIFEAAVSQKSSITQKQTKFDSQIDNFQKNQMMNAKKAVQNEIKAYKEMNAPKSFLKKYEMELKEIEDLLKQKVYSSYSKYSGNIRNQNSENPSYEVPYRAP